jgi:hypothetical protein
MEFNRSANLKLTENLNYLNKKRKFILWQPRRIPKSQEVQVAR